MLMHFFDAPAACACLCMFTMRTTLVSLPWLSKTQAFTLHLSFYKFLSESIKEWYFPWDDEYLQSVVKEKQHSQQCQHRELQTIEEIADMLCLQEHWNTEFTTSNTNRENPACCFVRLFELYQSTWCSTSCFYLQPQKNQQQDAGTPTIHLANTVACLCKQAGIQGHKINHSLWATVASRLYQAGVDEQLVMERTGYRSLDGIRSYQQTSEDLCQISQSQYVWVVILTLWNKHRQPFSHPPPLNFSSPMFNNCTVNFLVGSNPSESKHQRRAIVIDTDWLTEDNGEPCADSVLYTCY